MAAQPAETRPAKKRLRSLDSFRGMSLSIMIFVNCKAAAPRALLTPKPRLLTGATLLIDSPSDRQCVRLASRVRRMRPDTLTKLPDSSQTAAVTGSSPIPTGTASPSLTWCDHPRPPQAADDALALFCRCSPGSSG